MSFLSKNISGKAPFCTMVVAAAGSSTRMGQDKLFLELDGIPVLGRTLQMLERCPSIRELIVVTRQEKMLQVADLCKRYRLDKVTKVILGGSSRTESVLNGISEADPRAELIGVHDGARPFTSPETVEKAINEARFYQAVAPAVPLRDTIKRVENGFVVETLPREELMAVQTPQVFRAELLKGALTYVVQEDIPVTDDCAAVEAIGGKVHLIPGNASNLKLTHPLDVALALAILRQEVEE